ncbi:MAG TPA: hypothetical protein VLD19_01595, partial [Chitinophagaceae bacterium]|nr:hypothetical protein [Chitinophagaceae bacterium]
LVLKCIPNETKQRLQSAGDNFFKLVNDLQQDHPAKKSTDANTGACKNLMGDYDNQSTAAFVAALYTAAAPPYGVLAAPSLTHLLKATPEQPPEA